jgi:ribosomal protein S12 methylthiotransferase accessory factor
MEVIERDALMIAWHNELPCKRISPLDHPLPDVVELFRAYERNGVELQLYQLPTDTPCFVFLAVAVQKTGNGPAVVIGLGAGFSAVKASKSALLEVGQVRPAFKQRLQMPETMERLKILLEDPKKVENLEDHNLFYGAPDYISAFDFLFKQPVIEFNWQQEYVKEPVQQLESLLDYCRKENTDLIYCNLTPPDMQQLGLYTAKVIIPGFQPLHFGWKNIRLGGKRLFELPKKLGLRDTITGISQINLNPHPLA